MQVGLFLYFIIYESIEMGVWDTGILDDDDAADVSQFYLELYDHGQRHQAIRFAAEKRFHDSLNDEDDGPVITLALAYSQWECGYRDPEMITKIAHIVHSGINLERWEENANYQARANALEVFLEQLEAGNPKPRKRNRFPKPRAIFRAGECLAIRLSDGEYGAAFVLAEAYNRTGGLNLVGLLAYKGIHKPCQEVFEKRDWLLLNHHKFENEPYIHWCYPEDFPKDGIYESVGHSGIRDTDPIDSKSGGGWSFGYQLERQLAWDAGER